MPPFMGQGMCSGIRDAWNLTWKLALVLDGKSEASLHDTYQVERMPHVSQIIDLSIYLGKVICIADPNDAAQRDLAFKNGVAPPPPDFPRLTHGLLRKTLEGTVQEGAGLLAPHVTVRSEASTGRLDDVAGLGFMMVTTGQKPTTTFDAETMNSLHGVDMQYAALGTVPAAGYLMDLDGRLQRFLKDRGWDAMIVRPDFYVYGGDRGLAGRQSLVHDFLSDLQAAGVRMKYGSVVVPEAAVG